MKKLILAFLLCLIAAPAMAANCSPYPYTLQNGQTADANQVMSNFNTILTCGNNSLLGVNNNLSDLQSASTARTNLGLGTAATANAANASHTVTTVSGTVTDDDFPRFTGSTGDMLDSGISVPSILTQASNLAGLASTSTSRTNLGLGSIAVQNVTYSTSGPSGGGNAGDLWIQYVP